MLKAVPYCTAGHARARHYTLLEVVTVLAVIAVLSAVAVRAIVGARPSLEAATTTLKSDLRYVQARAMAGGTSHTWGLRLQADRYSLIEDGSVSSAVTLPESRTAVRVLDRVRITAGTGDVVFNAFGSAGSGNRNITLSDGSDTMTVVVTGGTGFVP